MFDLLLNLFIASRYAFAEAITMSVSDPIPLTIMPFFSILTVTSPNESVPSVILFTEYNCSTDSLLTIFSIALNAASTGPPPLDSLSKIFYFFLAQLLNEGMILSHLLIVYLINCKKKYCRQPKYLISKHEDRHRIFHV